MAPAGLRLAGARPVAPAERAGAVEGLWLEPLRHALTGSHRRDVLFVAETNRRGTGTWYAGICHYIGIHAGTLRGVRRRGAPSGCLAMLRAGEFYGLDQAGRVHAARISVDLSCPT